MIEYVIGALLIGLACKGKVDEISDSVKKDGVVKTYEKEYENFCDNVQKKYDEKEKEINRRKK